MARRTLPPAFLLLLSAASCGGQSVPKSQPQASPAAEESAPREEQPTPSERYAASGATFEVLETVPFPGKQDDIDFDPETGQGWYVNGKGYVYATRDGGDSWEEVAHKEGTFMRAIAHVEGDKLVAGNVGTDYFPGVVDTTPLYTSTDGGATWNAARVTEAEVKGVCAIDVLRAEFINHGVLEKRTTIRAAGRVGGPAKMATSTDGGASWKTEDLSAHAGMLLDIEFLDEQHGVVCASTASNPQESRARILHTSDGGTTWKTAYESQRPYELTWKCHFPTKTVGYATIQSYDPSQSKRYVAKTIDGGVTWTEKFIVDDPKVREFGVGFIDETTGWVGTIDGLWETRDGGDTWKHLPVGRAINKIRVYHHEDGFDVFAIGVDVLRLRVR